MYEFTLLSNTNVIFYKHFEAEICIVYKYIL